MKTNRRRNIKRYCLPTPNAVITDKLIMNEISDGSRVIDLGCGDGRLLCSLRDQRKCDVLGIELDYEEFLIAVNRGVPVLHGDLDRGLGEIPNDSFDYAVLSQTLQQVRHPLEILEEIFRVARLALVVIPNFGYWKIRWQVLVFGRAPVTSEIPYQWYNTPNLHFMSMHDFRDLQQQGRFKIIKEFPIIGDGSKKNRWLANFLAKNVLYVLERPEKEAEVDVVKTESVSVSEVP
jgi:methionine biosynthesis protein MetW